MYKFILGFATVLLSFSVSAGELVSLSETLIIPYKVNPTNSSQSDTPPQPIPT